MFSILLITLNEERNLPSCLASLDGCDDIVVLDSGSTDRTAEIARLAAARVFTHPFVNFAQQRNHGHEQISFKHEWILHLDADETLTPELRDECTAIARINPADFDGYFIAPRMLYHGRWIPHCTDFPAYQARFAHVKRFHFVQVGHGQREDPTLRIGTLQSSYLHNLSAHTDAELEAKHRRYAVHEATAFLNRTPEPKSLAKNFFSHDKLVRRRALKRLSQQLPLRSLLRFFYQYIWRRGFLDGGAGLHYCLLMSRYEGWIAAEIRRQQRAPQNTP